METGKETLKIQTPEQVGFRYELAGLGRRAAAFLLDTAFRFLFLVTLFIFLMLISRWGSALISPERLKESSGTWLLALGVLVYAAVDLGYFILFEGLWSGQTPGKRLQRLRVIRMDGQPIGWTESAIRNILRAVDMLAGFYPLGLIVMFFSHRNQRIGDYASGTVVIIEKRQTVPAGDEAFQVSDKPGVADLEFHLTTLKPEQYRLLKSFLQRRPVLDQEHRKQLARLLAERLRKRWGLPRGEGATHEAFLEEVVRAYERIKRVI